MNGYVEAGYLAVFVSLGTYGLSLLGRERAARRRVEVGAMTSATNSATTETATIAAIQDRSGGGAPATAAVPVASGGPAAAEGETAPGTSP